MPVMRAVLTALLALALVSSARAECMDQRRIIVPFPVGGSTYFTAKTLADGLEKVLGRPVRIDMRPGKFGINAIKELVGNADGCTLLVGSIITNSMTPVLHREDFDFDYDAEIVPISRIAEFPSVVVVAPDTRPDSLPEFLEMLRKDGKKLVLGTDFVGTYSSIDAIMLATTSSLSVAYHPNPNGALGILADLGERKSNIAFLNAATATQNVGRYKPLAVTGPQRLEGFAAPTMREAGYPNIGTVNWQGVFVSRRTPARDIEALYGATVAVMNSPQARNAMKQVNARAVVSETSAAFSAEIRTERSRWQQLLPELLGLPRE
jgi:tripartite-type tricarboxylate transporter receptor subunit TctC